MRRSSRTCSGVKLESFSDTRSSSAVSNLLSSQSARASYGVDEARLAGGGVGAADCKAPTIKLRVVDRSPCHTLAIRDPKSSIIISNSAPRGTSRASALPLLYRDNPWADKEDGGNRSQSRRHPIKESVSPEVVNC